LPFVRPAPVPVLAWVPPSVLSAPGPPSPPFSLVRPAARPVPLGSALPGEVASAAAVVAILVVALTALGPLGLALVVAA
jgi:hypothetical protein